MRRLATILLAVGTLAWLPPAAGAAGSPPTCAGLTATLWGTAGDDLLVGTGGDDVIVGKGGDDIIRGRGGDDVICGGPGNDTISGGPGNDILRGDGGDDQIRGGGGDDEINGWLGADTLFGGSGADLVLGHAGDDTLAGGRHDDDLRGGTGTDIVFGQGGADACRGEQAGGCELVPLSEGDAGGAVRFLQRALRERKLYRGAVDGVFDRDVAVAVATFHKVNGPAHTDPATAVEEWKARPPSEAMTTADWDRLLAYAPSVPRERTGQPDRVEVDVGRQVLYLILEGEVDAVVHVSTGARPDATPRTTSMPSGGHFWYKHPYDGWSPRPGQWSIYKFWAYRTRTDYNYGVHGYRDVPYYPASHGCTRVHVWDADYLDVRFAIGMPVHVWDA